MPSWKPIVYRWPSWMSLKIFHLGARMEWAINLNLAMLSSNNFLTTSHVCLNFILPQTNLCSQTTLQNYFLYLTKSSNQLILWLSKYLIGTWQKYSFKFSSYDPKAIPNYNWIKRECDFCWGTNSLRLKLVSGIYS